MPPIADSSESTSEPGDPTLLLHLTFEEDFATDGGAWDVSGHGFFAMCELDRCPQSVPGVAGQAAQLDGNDDYFRIPYDPAFDLGSELSIAVWVRYDGSTSFSTDSVVAKPVGAASLDSYELIINDEGADMTRDVSFKLSTGAGVDTTTAPWAARGEVPTWRHVAGVWTGEDQRLYVDGLLADEKATAAVAYDGHDLYVGADENTGSVNLYLPAAIDELYVFTRALTDDEIGGLATP